MKVLKGDTMTLKAGLRVLVKTKGGVVAVEIAEVSPSKEYVRFAGESIWQKWSRIEVVEVLGSGRLASSAPRSPK